MCENFLFGTYKLKLDDENKVLINEKWKDILGEEIVITRAIGDDRFLIMWKLKHFLDQAKRELEKDFTTEQRRLVIGKAVVLSIEEDCRIGMPDQLLEFFGKDREFYFMGVVNYVEIWKKDEYEMNFGQN